MEKTTGLFTTMEKNNQENQEPIKPIENRRPDGRFGPGNIANPNGRPRSGQALTDVMREMFKAKPEMKQKLMEKLYEMAQSGNLGAITEILDRIEGKPQVTADIHNTGEVVVIPQEVYNKYGATQDTTDSSEQQKKV